jgi:transcriptional regulator with XRE-family HTH domain
VFSFTGKALKKTGTIKVNVGAEIYRARNEAGLTQQELADRVGMKQSAIARLEDADYEKQSLTTLKRIALALGKRLEIKLSNQYVNESSEARVESGVQAESEAR